jgi:hypothetical protein
MCGNIQLSDKQKLFTRLGKNANLADKIYATTGLPFGGFARDDTLKTTWARRIIPKMCRKVQVDGFYEGSHYINRPGEIWVVAVVDFGDRGIRGKIVTTAADEEVVPYHDRMPKYVKNHEKALA